jgi:hypothetical protein
VTTTDPGLPIGPVWFSAGFAMRPDGTLDQGLIDEFFRTLSHPWEFPDRPRIPRPVLFPRLDAFRARVQHIRYRASELRLALRLWRQGYNFDGVA